MLEVLLLVVFNKTRNREKNPGKSQPSLALSEYSSLNETTPPPKWPRLSVVLVLVLVLARSLVLPFHQQVLKRSSSRFVGQTLSKSVCPAGFFWLAFIARPVRAAQKPPLGSLHTPPALGFHHLLTVSWSLLFILSSIIHQPCPVRRPYPKPSRPTLPTFTSQFDSPLTTLQTPTQTAVVILSLQKRKTPVVS